MTEMKKKPEAKSAPRKAVKVTHYKVFTSQGRFIAGQFAELPAAEADDLISKGHAVGL